MNFYRLPYLQKISIHAPTKGATFLLSRCKSDNPISIHAPTKGATVKLLTGEMLYTFQSTLPRRERRSNDNIFRQHRYFNPRSHEGSDDIVSFKRYAVWIFQSTLPRRERLKHCFNNVPCILFQSTLPRRERPSCTTHCSISHVFQSTLPRRERRR